MNEETDLITTEHLTLGDNQPKPAGTWDYISSNGPVPAITTFQPKTYTVAIFRWVKKNQRKATKKTTAVFRFKGNADQGEAIDAAVACCEELNRGTSAEEMFAHGVFKGKKSTAARPGWKIQHMYNDDQYLFSVWAKTND